MPRSVARTRLVDLVLAPDSLFGDDAAAAWRARIAADKMRIETCQAEHATGTAAAPAPGFAEFLKRLAAACAQANG